MKYIVPPTMRAIKTKTSHNGTTPPNTENITKTPKNVKMNATPPELIFFSTAAAKANPKTMAKNKGLPKRRGMRTNAPVGSV